MRALGLVFAALYQLHRHQWSGAPLDRWLAVGLVLAAGGAAVGRLPGGAFLIASCAGLLLFLFLLQAIAARQQYIIFRRQPPAARHDPQAATLAPADKLLLRATGLFEVEGKEQAFTELQAYFRSFETREHAVMAIVPPSSVLVIGTWPDHEIGMWYMFFKSQELRHVEPGLLCFGSRERPALRLRIEQQTAQPSSPLDVWGGYRIGKAKAKTFGRTIYLSFDSPQDRQRTLADLTADALRLAG